MYLIDVLPKQIGVNFPNLGGLRHPRQPPSDYTLGRSKKNHNRLFMRQGRREAGRREGVGGRVEQS